MAKFASNSCPYITLKNYPGKVFLSIDTLPETVSFRFENCPVVFTGSDRTITADSIYFHGVDISLQGGGSCKLEVTKGAEIHMDVFEKLKTNVFTGGVTINELRLYNSDEEFINITSPKTILCLQSWTNRLHPFLSLVWDQSGPSLWFSKRMITQQTYGWKMCK